ncbi:MAG: hypothetical protein JO006_17215 [Paucibacter sp.]|nr:hypothetical protein [Roseateles sp.]
MIRRFLILCLSIAVAGCATYAPSVPAGYTGPRAQLDDSAQTQSGSRADFFVVEQLDGAGVDNSLNETVRRNQGRGMSMTPYFISRPLIAEKPIKVSIRGRTHYAAPIQELTGTVYQVKGIVEFTPKANGRYAVVGELSESKSAVWIEDAETHQMVGQKVEVVGSARLGLFEK